MILNNFLINAKLKFEHFLKRTSSSPLKCKHLFLHTHNISLGKRWKSIFILVLTYSIWFSLNIMFSSSWYNSSSRLRHKCELIFTHSTFVSNRFFFFSCLSTKYLLTRGRYCGNIFSGTQRHIMPKSFFSFQYL